MSSSRVQSSLVSLLPVAVLGLTICFGPTFVLAQADGDAAGKTAAKEPEFKSEKYQKLFTEGKGLFEENDFKDAAKKFKSAERGAKSKEDKALVKAWGSACKGGLVLLKVGKMRQLNLNNEAYDELLGAMRRYANTPIGPKMAAAHRDLDKLLFHVLENFNYPNPRRYSKKYGKTAVTDKKLLVNGTNCLHWQSVPGQAGQLKIQSVPANWGSYQYLEFWVRVRTPSKAEVILKADATTKKGQALKTPPRGGGRAVPLLQKPIKLGKQVGWAYMRLDISEFQSQANADINRVKSLIFQFPRGKNFDFYIDEIRLRRKNPKKASGSGTRRR